MPMIEGTAAELEGVLNVARAMAVAARTAPKGRGEDAVETLLIHGDELVSLADAMEEHGRSSKLPEAFRRNADSVRNSHAVVLVGTHGPETQEGGRAAGLWCVRSCDLRGVSEGGKEGGE